MYVPDIFALNDADEVARVLRAESFALLVTAADGAPRASHLPFLHDPEAGAKGRLIAHMARANPQWRDLARLAERGAEALAVFQGPHAYVSPTWYGGGPAVPTWNYVAVHAYGVPSIVEEPARVREILSRLVDTHESGAREPWSLENLDGAFLARMMRGIVAFEMRITRLEAKAKLSQNKTAKDRRGVVAALEASASPLDRQVAARMRARPESPPGSAQGG